MDTNAASRERTSTSEEDRRPSTWSGARWRYECGVWAVPLALVPGFLIAAARGVPTPLEPLSEAIMLLTPVNVATVLLSALGNLAPTAGLLGAIALCLPLGGLLGLVAPLPPATALHPSTRTQPGAHWARWGAVVLLALLLVLPLLLNVTSAAAAGSALVVALAYAPALALVRHLRERQERRHIAGPPPSPQSPATTTSGSTRLSRRVLMERLAGTGFVVGSALVLGTYEFWSGPVASLFGRDLVSRVLFHFTPPAPRQPGFPVPGMVPEVTPNADFYLLSKDQVPPLVLPSEWTLRVSGAVARPLTLGYDQVMALPRIDEYVTLRCVDNPPNGKLMSTAYWSGVSMATLLARVGIDPSVDPEVAAIRMRAPADNYAELVPLSFALGPLALLAYGMNGATLPRNHGGPVRALVPGYFGFKNVKWIEGLEVLPTMPKGYWESVGFTASKIHPVARIDAWHNTAKGLLVGGVAFAGTSGVSAVEVSANGGAWVGAALNTPALSTATWVQWRVVLPLAPGKHTLTARMIDGAGIPQATTKDTVFPGGATGLDRVTVTR